MKSYNEIVKYIHIILCNNHNIIRRYVIQTHPVQEIVSNNVDIRENTHIETKACRLDIVILLI